MKYRYVTKTMAESAAKKGLKAAIKCSALKWWFIGTCTKSQLDLHFWYEDDDYYGFGENCALCEVCNTNCDICPLGSCFSMETPFRQADNLANIYAKSPTKTNLGKLQAKARKLARIIEKL